MVGLHALRQMPEKSLAVEIGHVLRDWRKERGVSQEEFAFRCGVSRTYMTHLEKGTNVPSIDVLARIARGFEVELSAIFLELEGRGATIAKTTEAPTPKWG